MRSTPYLLAHPKSWDLDVTNRIEDQFGAYHGHDNQLCLPMAAEPEGRAAADVFLLVASDLLTTIPTQPPLPVYTVHPLIIPHPHRISLPHTPTHTHTRPHLHLQSPRPRKNEEKKTFFVSCSSHDSLGNYLCMLFTDREYRGIFTS